FGTEFPGFQTLAPRDEFALLEQRPPLSRLQRRAPRPLELKPNTAQESSSGAGNVGSTTKASCFSSNDPIPLLSPLVLPSMLDSSVIQPETMTKSH
ncbi:hypothetical protein PHJA_002927700, partial [Phtheirospermum japonicum]